MRSTDFSAVICAYTELRWPQTIAAIRSVTRQAPREIILVIDHNPELIARARRAFPDVRVVPNQFRRGLSGGRNTGILLARAPVVAFLDDDAEARAGWLESLAAGYTNEDVLGVGGRATPQWASPGRPGWFPDEFDWVVGCSYRGMPVDRAPIRNLMGCNMSVRTSVLRELGGFHDDFGWGSTDRRVACEETDFCLRALRKFRGGHFLYEPQAVVDHNVPTERMTWSYFRTRCRAEGFSKALITRRLGMDLGLASERTYALRTLPAGVARDLRRGLSERNTNLLKRSAAIVAGLTLTATGYLEGQLVSAGSDA